MKIENRNINTELTEIAAYGNLNSIINIIDEGADIHYANELPLRTVAETGNISVVLYLIEHGANVHARDDDAFVRLLQIIKCE